MTLLYQHSNLFEDHWKLSYLPGGVEDFTEPAVIGADAGEAGRFISDGCGKSMNSWDFTSKYWGIYCIYYIYICILYYIILYIYLCVYLYI